MAVYTKDLTRPSGTGNYTGSTFGCGSGGFYDVNCNQRGSGYAVDIIGPATGFSVSEVPEPGTYALVIAGIGACLLLRKRA